MQKEVNLRTFYRILVSTRKNNAVFEDQTGLDGVEIFLDFWGEILQIVNVNLTGGSYSGNTTGSGPVNRGSNPRPPAN